MGSRKAKVAVARKPDALAGASAVVYLTLRDEVVEQAARCRPSRPTGASFSSCTERHNLLTVTSGSYIRSQAPPTIVG